MTKVAGPIGHWSLVLCRSLVLGHWSLLRTSRRIHGPAKNSRRFFHIIKMMLHRPDDLVILVALPGQEDHVVRVCVIQDHFNRFSAVDFDVNRFVTIGWEAGHYFINDRLWILGPGVVARDVDDICQAI